MLMLSGKNIVFHKSDFHPTRKRVGFTPQFITLCNEPFRYKVFLMESRGFVQVCRTKKRY